MGMAKPLAGEQNLHLSGRGTLAIDLGSTTTVVAFQACNDARIKLIDLAPISRKEGEVPSMLWLDERDSPSVLAGRQVLESGLGDRNVPQLHRDFKRWIGLPVPSPWRQLLSPDEAGARLLQEIWKRIPQDLTIDRLVLTAPVEAGSAYRQWLLEACESLQIPEIALVDEPTAAALGAGLPAGAKLLVVDLGGGTLDLSLVALEGGEGRAAPLAQLLRFQSRNLTKSRQALRQARVLGKAGIALGGRDLDRWILDALQPQGLPPEGAGHTALLDAAERLKCRLSSTDINDEQELTELASSPELTAPTTLRMNRKRFTQLLEERGLFQLLEELLNQTLRAAEVHGCRRSDLNAVVMVGGGAHLPQLRSWLTSFMSPVPLRTPPPMEAVACGALSLTPGVRILDLLQRGISLRCWDRRSNRHHWHPLFVAGQPWPSSQPFELVLSASAAEQTTIEFVLGEPELEARHEVRLIDGLPQVIERIPGAAEVKERPSPCFKLMLNPPGQPGEDCLKLQFHIDEQAELIMEGEDLRNGSRLERISLGTVR
ncbi:chaperone protein DnaK [Synechococcus sp. PROS-7-1]|uniref:Hsp70 family protein n=1 Tax=Synechococcus sp. PROS-7-1 TaxID=1442556 RepID=UPI0016451538|nr:Hsp70 family protein [Synechococcus sp. PROS-7-1]QNI86038.1 chaperone protein DnaK [Synechococcus sp. PROS-7-1]